MKIVLVHPEIPQNTGSIGRTCVALGVELILIKPYGFKIDANTVSRAGTRYWQFVNLSEYDSWADFMAQRAPSRDQLYFFEEHGRDSFYTPDYHRDAYLIFGRESTGLPPEILEDYADRTYHMPMPSGQVKSLNLSNAATAVVYQAKRAEFMGT